MKECIVLECPVPCMYGVCTRSPYLVYIQREKDAGDSTVFGSCGLFSRSGGAVCGLCTAPAAAARHTSPDARLLRSSLNRARVWAVASWWDQAGGFWPTIWRRGARLVVFLTNAKGGAARNAQD